MGGLLSCLGGLYVMGSSWFVNVRRERLGCL